MFSGGRCGRFLVRTRTRHVTVRVRPRDRERKESYDVFGFTPRGTPRQTCPVTSLRASRATAAPCPRRLREPALLQGRKLRGRARRPGEGVHRPLPSLQEMTLQQRSKLRSDQQHARHEPTAVDFRSPPQRPIPYFFSIVRTSSIGSASTVENAPFIVVARKSEL